jgi:hypothetical protein
MVRDTQRGQIGSSKSNGGTLGKVEDIILYWSGLIRVGGINRENRVYMVLHLTQTQQRERHKRGNSYLV